MRRFDRGPRIGQRFGRYELLELLGEGGMGRVFRAVDDDGRTVALKVIKEDLGRDPVFRRRFAREARAAAKVHHQRVVALLDVGEVDGLPYLAQSYVPGGTLDERLERDGPLGLPKTVRLALHVAAGLDALHAVGLVHRDLKPANILLDEDGCAYVTDFGLAKDRDASALTKPGQTVGSLDYMAPEQIRVGAMGPATDVYSLACVLWECLYGRPPFADRSGMQVLWAHLQEDPPDLSGQLDDVPAEVAWVLRQALAKEPERRPPTATAFAHLVQSAAGALAMR